MSPMSSRERVFTALNHVQPDRTPFDLFWQRQEIVDLLKSHFGVDDHDGILDAVGSDLQWGPGPRIRFPGLEERIRTNQHPSHAEDTKTLWHDDITYENGWGTVERFGSDGKYVKWVSGPLVNAETLDDLEKWSVPDIDIEPLEDFARRVSEAKAKDRVVISGVSLPFKQAWNLRGMEAFMMDMVANRDFAEYLLDRIYEHNTRIGVYLAKAGVDIISVVGDIGAQESLMFSPRLFRKLMKPRYAAFVQACKEANPDVKIFNHSDGNVTSVVGDYIDIGVDILNPIQPECMDAESIKKQYGDRLSFHGTLSVQETIPYGTVEEVRKEVSNRIETLGQGGGFILAPSNVITYDTPLENILEIFRTVGGMKE